jgi:NPCBM/NEW2 domain/Fibronectin type III domain
MGVVEAEPSIFHVHREAFMKTVRFSAFVTALALFASACSNTPATREVNLEDAAWDSGEIITGQAVAPLRTGFVSDQAWGRARSGYGPVERDRANGTNKPNDGGPIILEGKQYAKGLGVHSNSEITYNIAERCSDFVAEIGINDFKLNEAIGARGSVVFQVIVDGRVRFDSGVMRGDTPTKFINVNLEDAREMRLKTTDAGDGRNYDHAVWAHARVECPVNPAVPNATNFRATNATDSSITLTWDVVGGASAYRLDRRVGAGVFVFVGVFESPLNVVDANLLPDTEYTHRLRAITSNGTSSGTLLTARTAKTSVADVTNFRAIEVTSERVRFDWDEVPDAFGYILDRKQGTGAYSNVGSFQSSFEASDSTVAPATTYTYRLRFNSPRGSSNGVELTVTTPATIPNPANFRAVNITTTSVTFDWDDIPTANAFGIDRKQGTDFVNIGSFESSLNASDRNLEPDTEYTYRIKTITSNGTSSGTEITIRTLPVTAPPRESPNNLSATARSPTSAALRWSRIFDATAYEIERAENNSDVYTPVGTTTELTFNPTGLKPNTLYTFRVRGTNAFGGGPWSFQVAVTPNAP